jgi:hypothetical protein
MNPKYHESLKSIRFAGELLPDWAQILDVAARLCPVSPETRSWFSRFTVCSGVDDARTVLEMCIPLRASIQEQRAFLAAELRRNFCDTQPAQILAAWKYTLDTMIQEAQTRKTCSWIIDGSQNIVAVDSDGGDIELRRV